MRGGEAKSPTLQDDMCGLSCMMSRKFKVSSDFFCIANQNFVTQKSKIITNCLCI